MDVFCSLRWCTQHIFPVLPGTPLRITTEKVIILFRFSERTAQKNLVVSVHYQNKKEIMRCCLTARGLAVVALSWCSRRLWSKTGLLTGTLAFLPNLLSSLNAERDAESSLPSEVTSEDSEWRPGCGLENKRLWNSLHVISKDVVKQSWEVFQYIFFSAVLTVTCRYFKRYDAISCSHFFCLNVTILQYFALWSADKQI